MSLITRELSLEQLGPAIQQVAKWLPELGVWIHRYVHFAVAVRLPVVSPVGSFPEDPHPGKFRGSHLASVGSPRFANLPDKAFYPIPGAVEVEAALRHLRPGQKSYQTNDAATLGSSELAPPSRRRRGRRRRSRRRPSSYASALERGRSPQAPSGVFGPVLRDAERNGARIVAEGIVASLRELDRRLG